MLALVRLYGPQSRCRTVNFVILSADPLNAKTLAIPQPRGGNDLVMTKHGGYT
jgi:hypothetical protein